MWLADIAPDPGEQIAPYAIVLLGLALVAGVGLLLWTRFRKR